MSNNHLSGLSTPNAQIDRQKRPLLAGLFPKAGKTPTNKKDPISFAQKDQKADLSSLNEYLMGTENETVAGSVNMKPSLIKSPENK